MAFTNAIALTGSIGTGKSTVNSLLKLHGYTIIDLDKISHSVIENIHQDLIELFGEKVIENGKVDRKAIGKIVFNDKEKLKELENIIHPLIQDEVTLQSKDLEAKNIDYFIDIPLFFEKGESYGIKRSVVVYCPKDIQIERVSKRDNLSFEEAKKRVELQIDIEEKKEKTDFVIDNSQDINYLSNEVNSFVSKLRGE